MASHYLFTKSDWDILGLLTQLVQALITVILIFRLHFRFFPTLGNFSPSLFEIFIHLIHFTGLHDYLNRFIAH